MLTKTATMSAKQSDEIVNALKVGVVRAGLEIAILAVSLIPASTLGWGTPVNSALCRETSCASGDKTEQYQRPTIQIQSTLGNPVNSSTSWRLVRTPGPEKTGDVVSVMRTADFLRSDPNFAGLAIRCRARSGLQVAFVVITPFHPRTHPKVAVSVNRTPIQFQADVIPPGSMIALPQEAEVLAKGPWQSAKELSVDIEGDEVKIHGVVSLEGLSGAIAQLQASCPQ